MDTTAVALADLEVALGAASDSYRAYAEYIDFEDGRSLLRDLADERLEDRQAIASAVLDSDLEVVEPQLDPESASVELRLGLEAPPSLASMAYRVQRAENTLGLMLAQLLTLSPYAAINAALRAAVDHIENRRDDVRLLRRQARSAATEFAPHAGALPATPEERPGEEVTVWFASNRELNGRNFMGRRGTRVLYGRCFVFVPRDRPVGALEWPRGLLGHHRVSLSGVDLLEANAFWNLLTQESSRLDTRDRQGLVFLHGYCTKFEDAARRTAQLKVDLGHLGPAAFFSWPSLGKKIGYSNDEAAIEGSEAAIQTFLTDFARRSGVTAVHIIAHSMGNRALLRAMASIAERAAARSNVRFGQLILAAPDVDTELFVNLASAYSKLAARTTLYVAENDQALGLSGFGHRAPRAGRAPPVTLVAGVDTINVTKVNLGLVGHGYATELRPVLTDMHDLIHQGTEPERRFGLRPAGTPQKRYWTLR
jgi:esterase/lipase superfamily enzyme